MTTSNLLPNLGIGAALLFAITTGMGSDIRTADKGLIQVVNELVPAGTIIAYSGPLTGSDRSV